MFLKQDAKAADAGLYKCVVANELGECVVNAHIQFQANKASLAKTDLIPPTLLDKPSISNDDTKKCIRFECRLRAKPEAQIQWFKDGAALTANAKNKFEVKKDGDNIYIVALEVYVSDASVS